MWILYPVLVIKVSRTVSIDRYKHLYTKRGRVCRPNLLVIKVERSHGSESQHNITLAAGLKTPI